MSTRLGRSIVVLIVAAHIGLLLAYSLPRALVQERLFYWSQWYVRPVFHQQWDLFAPDPPMCACGIEVGLPDGGWKPIMPEDRHYLVRRMARPLADHIHAGILHGDTVVQPVLAEALRNLTREMDRAGELRSRSVQRCVVDPEHPEQRTVASIELILP